MPIDNITTPEEAAKRLTDPGPPDPKYAFEREFIRQQQRYEDLRYKVSLGLLIGCPALALIPPRKLDWYTFGLGSAWLYCLSEVSAAHGRDMFHGFQRREDVALKLAQKPEVDGVKVGGWKGEKIIKEYRPREEEASSYGSLIMEQIWDVWEQRDRGQKDKKKGPEVNVREEILKKIGEGKDARDRDGK